MTGFLSTLRSNSITPGWSLRERTYVSSANTLFDGTQVSDYTFNSANNALGQNITSGLAVGAGPFSVTERYTITAINQGSSKATIDMFAVPEPTTWALMILGFGGVGAMVRGRRRQAMATA